MAATSVTVPMETFLTQETRRLRDRGFDPEQALAVTATCRDEILAPLRGRVRAHWHRAFDFSSLSGLPLAGVTGASAVLDHAPQTGARAEVVIFALPHIGVLADGTVGLAMRRGRATPTSACGSLVAAMQWARSPDAALQAAAIDPSDPEQSLVRQRLLRDVPDLADADLFEVTRRLRELMVQDVRTLVDRVSSPHAADVAIVSGVLVHGPDGLDHVEPAESWTRVAGVETTLPGLPA